MTDNSGWFAAKRYGIGASWPIGWKGWVLTVTFVILVAAAKLVLRQNLIGFISVLTILCAAFTLICARKTRGGWRWRWGGRG